MKPARAGHVLAEVMVSAAVVAWAMGGIASGVIQGRGQLAVGLKEQQLNALAQQKLEQLTLTPSSVWVARAGTQDPIETNVDGNPGWTRTTTYSPLTLDPNGSSVAASASEVVATIVVAAPDGTSASRVSSKWKAY